MAPPPRPLSEIPTLSLLYKLKKLTPSTDQSPYAASPAFNGLISLIRTDITTLEVGAIVNAANTSLLGGGGVDAAIHARAGPQLVEECETLDGCDTGDAKITDAYELPCQKVIHAVGPVYWAAKREQDGLEKELLRGCYRRALELTEKNGLKSVAFSAISTGVYGYPSPKAAYEALDEVRKWVDEKVEEKEGSDAAPGGVERIIFCCFERKDEKAYEELLPLFFPPVPQDQPSARESPAHASLMKDLPDPPTTEPSEPGQPDAKKPRLDSDSAVKPAEAKTTAATAATTATDREHTGLTQEVEGTKLVDDDDLDEDDWEPIEKPSERSLSPPSKFVDDFGDEKSASDIENGVMSQDQNERTLSALHSASTGGGDPRNQLEKDW